MKKRTSLILGSLVFFSVSFGLARYWFLKQQTQQFDFLAKENVEIFIRNHSPRMGNPQAKVHIVEFLDPECESCRAFYPHVKQVMDENPGKIHLVVRYVPFHHNSKLIIRILEAARKQNKFWETLALLFEHQPKWGDHHNPRPELVWDYLPQIGLNLDKLRLDMQNPDIDKVIQQDLEDSKTLQVRATPSFFINGRKLNQFGYQAFKQAVEREISKYE